MRFLKYNAGRGLVNVGRNQVTQLVPNGLKLETLGRKIKPSARAQEGRAGRSVLGKTPMHSSNYSPGGKKPCCHHAAIVNPWFYDPIS
jgi:hypothetical protein